MIRIKEIRTVIWKVNYSERFLDLLKPEIKLSLYVLSLPLWVSGPNYTDREKKVCKKGPKRPDLL